MKEIFLTVKKKTLVGLSEDSQGNKGDSVADSGEPFSFCFLHEWQPSPNLN